VDTHWREAPGWFFQKMAIEMKFARQNNNMKERARLLRKNSTLSEVLLWNELKQGQMRGLDFDRQKVINNRYILDFYCPALGLAIEVDGASHDGKYEYDVGRHNYLTGLGIKVLHFDDADVKKNIGEVLADIDKVAQELLATTPPLRGTPSPAKGIVPPLAAS
jgi:very-short-patch-repair endonuclease